MAQVIRWVLRVQGAMYVVTGVWPLLHMASFEAVTGPKTDDWLVHTVGLLLAVIGAVLLVAAARPAVDRLIVALAIGAALALAAIEIVYVMNGTISRIYLLDAAIELAFAVVLTAGLMRPGLANRPS
jgi:predicted PilT family ATPase